MQGAQKKKRVMVHVSCTDDDANDDDEEEKNSKRSHERC